MKPHALTSWLKAALLAGIGGGIAGATAAGSDPAKYRFPQDFGTGKLWPFFFQGALLTMGAMLLKSPLGIKLMDEAKKSRTEEKDNGDHRTTDSQRPE